MKPKQVSKCVTRLTYTKGNGIKTVILRNHSFGVDETCNRCGLEVEGIAQLLVDEQFEGTESTISGKESKAMEFPFKVGDIVCKDGLFGKQIKIVNRISKVSDGWVMFISTHLWVSEDYIVNNSKLVRTDGWYKV